MWGIYNAWNDFIYRAYEPDTDCFKQIIQHFGQELINHTDGTIDRRILGQKVFADPDQLRKLESMVWPEILKLAKEEINKFHAKGVQIVILDAAVLLQGNHWIYF